MPRVKRKVCRLVGRGHYCFRDMPKRQILRYGRGTEKSPFTKPASSRTVLMVPHNTVGTNIDLGRPTVPRAIKWWPAYAKHLQDAKRLVDPCLYQPL